jgi:hypothetical protein
MSFINLFTITTFSAIFAGLLTAPLNKLQTNEQLKKNWCAERSKENVTLYSGLNERVNMWLYTCCSTFYL